jgi:hypothetical protein
LLAITYKRLARAIDVPAGGATMSFWTSYDTEPAWDHVFVEAHTVGQDNWTTPGAPPGSAPNSNDFTRTTLAGFPEGP